MTVFAVLVGGGIGAVCRFGVETVVVHRQHTPFPLSTLVVNVTGSTALGAVVGLMLAGVLAPGIAPVVVSGFFGGFTTFSTFTYENLRLMESGAWRHLFWNLALSGPLSFAGAGAGYLAATKLA